MKRCVRFLERGPRRKLLGLAVACLCGVYAAGFCCAYARASLALFALFASLGALARLRRRGAFAFAALATACLFYAQAASQLALRDAPTPSRTSISGVVSRVVYDGRVALRDVTLSGGARLSRPAVVTLMLDEYDARAYPTVGERVSGLGRLFAQDEPRNPGESNRRVAALADGYELSGYLLPGWSVSGEARFSPQEAFRRAREALLARLSLVFGEDAPLLQGVLLGDSGEMDEASVAAMRLTGTAHLLAVSGLHLSLIGAMLGRLLRRLTPSRRARWALKTLLLTAFAALTGFAAGTVRALLMSTLRSVAALRGKRYDPLTALSFAALAMTFVRPLWPLTGSFQFSFFVVLGILLLCDRLSALLLRLCPANGRRRAERPVRLLCVSAGAQIAAVPVQLRFYGFAPLLALPMNLLCGLLAPVLLFAGWAGLLVSALSLPLAQACAGALALPGRAFLSLSAAAANIPGGIVRLPAPYAATVALCVLLMALCSKAFRMPRRAGLYRAATLALIAALTLPRFDPTPRYVQLDVGQGDAAVLRRGREAVLVDVGPLSSYAALRYVRSEGLLVRMAVLSHLDQDHAGALGTLLSSEVDIPALALPERAEEDGATDAVTSALALARAQGLDVLYLSRGDRFEAAGMAFDVLSPSEELEGDNERSLLLSTEVEGVRFLLAGDLPAACEPEEIPDCDVLKVAHHGSANATSARFLEAATPSVALISVGAGNSYGHPTARVLQDLASAGAQVLRTDEAGCVTLRLKDGAWRAQTFLPPEE